MIPWLRRLADRAVNGEAWPLRTYLAIGLLLRLPAVLCAGGYESGDMQFQSVDPAWHLATGDAWSPTWEWIDGVRSWVYPGLLAGLFRGFRLLGLEEPLWLMRGVRFVHALLSLVLLWLFWQAVVRWRPVAAPRGPLLLVAVSGLVVAIGVQPSSATFAATLAVAAVLAFHGPRWYPLLAGALLGLAFCGRVQEALFGPALVATGLWQRRHAATALFVLGCLPGVLLQGCVDLAVRGTFLWSPWAYFEVNVLWNAASKWPTRPWWFYLVLGVVPVLACVPPFLRLAAARLTAGARILPGALAAATLHLVVHSCIARKALRFEHGALAVLLVVVAAGLGASGTAGRWAVSYRRVLAAVHGALWVWASFTFGNAGAIRVAEVLRRDPSFRGEAWVVDGDVMSLGGSYYLRQERLAVTRVPREELARRLAESPPADGAFVVAVRAPLDDATAGAGRWELVASVTGQLDLRTRDRRFVYRWRR